jgi:hypothetical protein
VKLVEFYQGLMLSSGRIYECDTDAMFLRLFRQRAEFEEIFFKVVTGRMRRGIVEVLGQQRHLGSTGSIDLVLKYPQGPIILIENKIDAGYSVTREGHGQPHRYQKTVAAYRSQGAEVYSVVLAPECYLKNSRLAHMFDRRISYESLSEALDGDDLALLEAAIRQADAPYEPVPNESAMDFFKSMRQLVLERYPALAMKRDPNADGVRPVRSRTVYFDVPKALRIHLDAPRPRMSLQCWDSSAPSASVKIMLTGLARVAERLSPPRNLSDVGGYLRRAAGSLGIVIDTPRLDTQEPFADQADDVAEALEAALRLQKWWNENGDTLRSWTQTALISRRPDA